MTIAHDLRSAVRSLGRSPGFTAMAVLALALGIGANAAIFSLVNSVMLRPLPYRDVDRLYLAHLEIDGGDHLGPQRMPWSYPKWERFTQLEVPFESLAGFAEDSFNLTSGGDPERVQAELVSPSYFSILGQRPVLGALFAANAERPDGGDRVALIGEGLWHRRFGGDPSVIGRTVELDRKQLTVIGVLPAAFHGLTGKADVWIPLSAPQYLWYPEALTEAGNHWFDAVGRVRAGTTPERLAGAMRAAGTAIDAAFPRPAEINDGSTWTAAATSLVAARRDPALRRALLVLLGAVAAVLLIACANLGNLLLVRATARRREIAVRSALGASRGQLVRQMLAESVVLAGFGGASGLLVARWTLTGLAAIRPGTLEGWGVSSTEGLDLASATIDLRVVAFGFALALLVGVATGLVPALRAARFGFAGALKEGAGVVAGAGGHRRGWGRGALVAGELALALMLLASAGLLLRSFGKLSHLELGFAPERLLTAQFHAAEGEYTRDTALQFHTELLARVEAIPGVVSASLSTCGPLTQGCNGTLLTRIDGKPRDVRERIRIGVHFLSPKHLATLRAPLVEGREFTAADRAGVPRVALVSAALAHKLWPGESALGHHLAPGQGGFGKDEQAEVIGVVGDLRYGALADAPELDVYLAESQAYPNARMLFVRTAGDPLALLPAVRAAMKSVSPNIPLYGVRSMEERLGDALSRARFAAFLLAVFAGLALLLAVLGVYGVLAFAVTARRREIGLRIALGAQSRDIAGMVLRQGMALAVVGTLAGLAGAWALSGVLQSLLYGVGPQDPVAFAGGPAILLVAALLACLIPARRAVGVEPMRVLREE